MTVLLSKQTQQVSESEVALSVGFGFTCLKNILGLFEDVEHFINFLKVPQNNLNKIYKKEKSEIDQNIWRIPDDDF